MHFDDDPKYIDPVRLPKPKLPDYRGFRVLPGLYQDDIEEAYFQVTTVHDNLSVYAQEVTFDSTWTVVALGEIRRFEWIEFCRELAMGRFVPVERG